MMSTVYQVEHPLVQHHLSLLRSTATDPPEFRRLIRRLAVLLAYEATKDLQLVQCEVQTPLAVTAGCRLSQRIGLIPILRAGLGMVDPIIELIPTAEVWHLGVYRDETTFRPVEYYCKLPPGEAVDVAMVVDPMLATGGSAVAALETLQSWGVPDTRLVAVIAAAPGIAEVQSKFPNTPIYVAGIDAELNDQAFIVPGLGDAGDRTFNTMRDG